MTREQIEAILKSAQAKTDKEGAHAMPDGVNMTIHVAHAGATIALQKVETVRFDGEILHGKSAKQTVSVIASDVFAVSVEGASGAPPRRPAGFL